KTVEEFRRPELPGYDSPIPNVVVENNAFGVGAPIAPAFPQPGFPAPAPFGVPGAPVDPNAPPGAVVKELIFDIAAKPWMGNLGQFLREQLKLGEPRVR